MFDEQETDVKAIKCSPNQYNWLVSHNITLQGAKLYKYTGEHHVTFIPTVDIHFNFCCLKKFLFKKKLE